MLFRSVVNLNVIGRATQGVRLINLDKRNDEIASVCKVLSETEEEEIAGIAISENTGEENVLSEKYSQTDDAKQDEESENTTNEE